MGLIDASKPRSYTPRRGLLAPIIDETTTTGSMESQSIGGERTSDPRSSGKDQLGPNGVPGASYASFSEMMNNPNFRGDWGKVGAMLSPGLSMARNVATGEDPIQGSINPNAPAQAYEGGDWSGPAGDPNAGGGEYGGLGGNRDGGFSKGGIVKRDGLLGPNPPGPDQGYQALRDQERVITPEAYAGFSKATKAEIDAAMKKAKK